MQKKSESTKPAYRVIVGAFSSSANAGKLVAELKKKGYDAIIKPSKA